MADYRFKYKIKMKSGQLGRKIRKFGEISLKPAPTLIEMEKYEREKGDLVEEIEYLKKDLEELKTSRKATKKHITLGELPEDDRFLKLPSQRKHFLDTIKMIAYRAETAMASIIRQDLSRPDDARAIVREILTKEADIIPNYESMTLTVRLHHMSNPLSNRVVESLAKNLNETKVLYPGTELQLVLELVSR